MIGCTLIGIDHHRILHAGTWSILQRELWELVWEPERRVELECVPGDRECVGEERCAARQEKLMHRYDAFAGNRRACGLPDELFRGRPREVVDAVGDEMPHQSLTRGSSLPGSNFIGSDDGDGAVALEHV